MMHRTTAAAALLLLAALTGCAPREAAPNADAALRGVTIAPYVMAVSPTAAAIAWETAEPLAGAIELSGNGTTVVAHTGVCGTFHVVVVSNLPENTRYTCRIAGTDGAETMFRTLSAERLRYTAAILGDNRSDPASFMTVSHAVASHDVDLVLSTGDIVADGRKLPLWQREWFRPAAPMLRAAPVIIAWGSHEAPMASNSWLHYYYGLRSPLRNRAYFAFRQGPVLYIVLNTEEEFGLDSPQYRWLADTLARRTAPFTVVLFHVAALSSSAHANDAHTQNVRRYLVPLLVREQVDLVVNGHDHTYDRSVYEGVPFVICGGAGAPLYASRLFLNPYSLVYTSCFNYAMMDVSPEQLSLTVQTPDGTVLDRFTCPRRERAADKPAVVAAFRPPLRDYLDEDTIGASIYLRNFSDAFVTGTVAVTAPAQWFVDPGRELAVYLRRDEPFREFPVRLWPDDPKPGVYPLRVDAVFDGRTSTMTCAIEQFDLTKPKCTWSFAHGGTAPQCSNAVNAAVSDGIWHVSAAPKEPPVLYAPVPGTAGQATARDVFVSRMCLSGTCGVTRCTITLYCDNGGKTSQLSRVEAVPVNGQWYTRLWYVGRELGWRGTPVGFTITPADDAGVVIAFDNARLCTPPEPAAEKERE